MAQENSREGGRLVKVWTDAANRVEDWPDWKKPESLREGSGSRMCEPICGLEHE